MDEQVFKENETAQSILDALERTQKTLNPKELESLNPSSLSRHGRAIFPALCILARQYSIPALMNAAWKCFVPLYESSSTSISCDSDSKLFKKNPFKIQTVESHNSSYLKNSSHPSSLVSDIISFMLDMTEKFFSDSRNEDERSIRFIAFCLSHLLAVIRVWPLEPTTNYFERFVNLFFDCSLLIATANKIATAQILQDTVMKRIECIICLMGNSIQERHISDKETIFYPSLLMQLYDLTIKRLQNNNAIEKSIIPVCAITCTCLLFSPLEKDKQAPWLGAENVFMILLLWLPGMSDIFNSSENMLDKFLREATFNEGKNTILCESIKFISGKLPLIAWCAQIDDDNEISLSELWLHTTYYVSHCIPDRHKEKMFTQLLVSLNASSLISLEFIMTLWILLLRDESSKETVRLCLDLLWSFSDYSILSASSTHYHVTVDNNQSVLKPSHSLLPSPSCFFSIALGLIARFGYEFILNQSNFVSREKYSEKMSKPSASTLINDPRISISPSAAFHFCSPSTVSRSDTILTPNFSSADSIPQLKSEIALDEREFVISIDHLEKPFPYNDHDIISVPHALRDSIRLLKEVTSKTLESKFSVISIRLLKACCGVLIHMIPNNPIANRLLMSENSSSSQALYSLYNLSEGKDILASCVLNRSLSLLYDLFFDEGIIYELVHLVGNAPKVFCSHECVDSLRLIMFVMQQVLFSKSSKEINDNNQSIDSILSGKSPAETHFHRFQMMIAIRKLINNDLIGSELLSLQQWAKNLTVLFDDDWVHFIQFSVFLNKSLRRNVCHRTISKASHGNSLILYPMVLPDEKISEAQSSNQSDMPSNIWLTCEDLLSKVKVHDSRLKNANKVTNSSLFSNNLDQAAAFRIFKILSEHFRNGN